MGKILSYTRNLKFRYRLFLSYIVVIIIPITVLGMYSYSQSSAFLLQQAKQGLSDSVNQLVENINYRIRRYDSAIDFIAMNKRIQQIVTNDYKNVTILYLDLIEQIDPVFQSTLAQNQDIEQISIYTSNNTPEYGTFILSLGGLRETAWVRDSDQLNNTNWYGDQSNLYGIRRIYKENADEINLIYICLQKEKVFDNLYDLKYDEGGILITDDNDNIILENSSEALSKTEIDIIKKSEGMVIIKDKECLIIKSNIPTADWTFHFFIPVNSIAVNVDNILRVTIIIVSACILFLLLLTWLFSNSFVKRIDRLNRKIDLVDKGNMDIEIKSEYTDEIGDMTNKFGKMLSNINMLIKEVYESSIEKRELEMRVLQAQINPHFLYNTLSIINWKALEIDAEEISYITTSVSSFYRAVLNKGEKLVTIRTEIETTKLYIGIQLIMHNDSFDVRYEIDEDIYDYKIINITLQPIVENAIGHGIDTKEDGRGLLVISGKLLDGDIVISVSDNGPGINREAAKEILQKSSAGYGLKNVNDRLKLLYGSNYGIEIVESESPGTQVNIRIPVQP